MGDVTKQGTRCWLGPDVTGDLEAGRGCPAETVLSVSLQLCMMSFNRNVTSRREERTHQLFLAEARSRAGMCYNL